MSVSGLCEICQQPDVEHTCDRCGQLVCDRHFDTETGVCIECVADLGRSDPTGQRDSGDNLPDGVDIYEY